MLPTTDGGDVLQTGSVRAKGNGLQDQQHLLQRQTARWKGAYENHNNVSRFEIY